MSFDADNGFDITVDSISAGEKADEQTAPIQRGPSADEIYIENDGISSTEKAVDEREKCRNKAVVVLCIVCVALTALVIVSTVIAYGLLGVDYLVVVLMNAATAMAIMVISSVSLIYRKRNGIIYAASVLAIIFSVATVAFLMVGMTWVLR